VTIHSYTTRPMFAGDDWHELRDALHECDTSALALYEILGMVCHHYLRAAQVTGTQDDPVARSLRAERHFPRYKVAFAHHHLAAFWRIEKGFLSPRLEGMTDLRQLVRDFRDWATREAMLWFLDAPLILNRFARVLANEQPSRVLTLELDLADILSEFYPLLDPECEDMVCVMAHRRARPRV
jgi:hypothetical protein